MRSHPADTLVSLGGQRVARAAAKGSYVSDLLFEGAREKSPEDAELYLARLARAKSRQQTRAAVRMAIPASEAEAWKDPVEALTDYGPRHPAKPKPLSDRMNVGE